MKTDYIQAYSMATEDGSEFDPEGVPWCYAASYQGRNMLF
jgi:hypothetical protein